MLQPPLPSYPFNHLNPTLAEVTPKRSKPGRQGSLDHPRAQGLGEFVPVTRKCVNCRAVHPLSPRPEMNEPHLISSTSIHQYGTPDSAAFNNTEQRLNNIRDQAIFSAGFKGLPIQKLEPILVRHLLASLPKGNSSSSTLYRFNFIRK